MVKHVIIWTLKAEYTDAEKAQIKKGIKEGLEGLKDKVPGIVEIKVHTEGLQSSNTDLILDSTFTDEAALAGYSVHSAHMEVATTKVRPYTAVRSCFDYTV